MLEVLKRSAEEHGIQPHMKPTFIRYFFAKEWHFNQMPDADGADAFAALGIPVAFDAWQTPRPPGGYMQSPHQGGLDLRPPKVSRTLPPT